MYEVFVELCERKGVTPYKVSKETGIARSSLSDWKNGKSKPKADKIKLLADYFGVPVDAFYGVPISGQNEEYYIDADARELAEFLHKNPEYRVLLDASRKVKKKDIQFVMEMIERLS